MPIGFRKKKFLTDFSQYIHRNKVAPLLSKLSPLVSWLEQTWVYSSCKCFHTSFRFTSQMIFEKKIKNKSIYSNVQNSTFPPFHCISPGDHGMNELKYLIHVPEDASMQVLAFLATWFLRKKFDSPWWPHLLPPPPGDHVLNKP